MCYYRIVLSCSVLLALCLVAGATPPKYLPPFADARARLPELIQQLQDKDTQVRWQAANTLANLVDDRAAGALAQALHDEDAGVRERAVRGVVYLDDGRQVGTLFNMLREDPSENVRRAVRETITSMRDPAMREVLLRETDSPDTASRCLAAEMLGYHHSPEVIDRLVMMRVHHPDAATDRATTLALGQLGDFRAVPGLVQMMRNASAEDRARCIGLLGRTHQMTAMETVVAAASDPDASVRAKAFTAMSEITDPGAFGYIAGIMIYRMPALTPQERRQVSEILIDMGPAAEPALINALGNGEVPTRRWAARTLGYLEDPQAVDPLLRALGDTDLGVRYWAIDSLERLNDRRAVPELIKLLPPSPQDQVTAEAKAWRALYMQDWSEAEKQASQQDGPPVDALSVRGRAVRALGRLNDPSAVKPLAALFKEKDPWLHRELRRALERLDYPETTHALLPLLRTGNRQTQEEIVEILGATATAEAVPALLDLLNNRRLDFRYEIVYALAHTRDPRANAAFLRLLKQRDDDVFRVVASELAKAPTPEVREILLDVLNDPNRDRAIKIPVKDEAQSRMLFGAVIALGEMHEPEAVPGLRAVLMTTDISGMYMAAAKALQHIGTEEAAQALIAVTRARQGEQDKVIRWQAYLALDSFKGPEVTRALIEGAQDDWVFIREACTKALADNADPASREALLGLLSDQAPDVRRSAARGLGRNGGPGVADALIVMLQDDYDARDAAAEALGELKEERARPALSRMARRGSVAAVGALVRLGGEASIRELREIAQGTIPWSRVAALRGLEQLGDPEVEPLYRQALRERNPLVMGWSAIYLARHGATDVQDELQAVKRYCDRKLSPNARNSALEELRDAMTALEKGKG
ncbi:MAG: HEAT repeat domain-containing protein [Armatimonadota bacterium]